MMMPTGVLINGGCVFVGGLMGAVIGNKLNKDFCENLSKVFGICSMVIGVSGIIKMQNLPAVVLAVILGTMLGYILHLEEQIIFWAEKLKKPFMRLRKNQDKQEEDAFMNRFVSIVVLFCASGTGIFGALQSGITGDHTILIAKSILDFFTAIIFAAGLGYIVMTVSVLQLLVLGALFFLSGFIMPFTTAGMLADFSACGGALILATGFRIAEIRNFPIVNMIPAMVLVMPLSALWVHFFV